MGEKDFDHSKIEGTDADIEISLKEYGFAWIENEKETLFYYGISFNNEYDRFDFCIFSNDMNIKEEFDWGDWKAINSFTGVDIDEVPLVWQIYDLNQYYGYENVFGSKSWGGLTYDEVIEG